MIGTHADLVTWLLRTDRIHQYIMSFDILGFTNVAGIVSAI